MEDYKEKYEEVLKRAKSAIKECGDNKGRITMIKSIFPELAETEDEMIRETILLTIKSQGFISDEETLRQCVAWLEKQKSFKWSETDNNRLSNLFGIIDSADNWNIPSKIAFKDWLQSIKKKLKGE